MEFPALLNKQQVDFPGVNQHCTIEFPSSIEFPWVIKKNSWAVFRGVLVSGLKVSARCNTLLQSFQGHSLVLYRISRGKVKHVKTPGFFSKKYVLTPPPSPPQLFDFFLEQCMVYFTYHRQQYYHQNVFSQGTHTQLAIFSDETSSSAKVLILLFLLSINFFF